MSDWNIIVLSLFSATYLPLFWFVGMRIASEDILRKSKFYEVDPNVLVPGWAKTCTTVFCVLHYCLFIIPLTMIDWLHGLAAFGAGILLLVFLPLFRKSYYSGKAICLFLKHTLCAFTGETLQQVDY
ncbi:hypothetical protein [Klebsiella variicola]|uniref:hypothetical protein n=1 Tax=Klebsiella variicola TaxID=244366 RepID=UPI002232275A|nr:hypothetical protein [Klebsiella variicola]